MPVSDRNQIYKAKGRAKTPGLFCGKGRASCPSRPHSKTLPRRLPLGQAGGGFFDVPLRLLEGAPGFGLGGVGELADDAHCPVAQLGVAGVEVDHQVADDVAALGHRQRGDHVQDQLGGGAALEPGGAGQQLGAKVRLDDDARPVVAWDFQRWVEAEQRGFRAAPVGLPDAAPHERRPAAGGDADEHVLFSDTSKTHRLGTGVGVVLGALDRAVQRRLATGDDALHLLRVDAKGGRAFAGVEHAQAAARASTAVEKPPPVLERITHPADHAHDFVFLAGDGGGELAVLIEKQVDGLAKRHAVELHRARVSLLGRRLAKLGEAGHGDGRAVGPDGGAWLGRRELGQAAGEVECAGAAFIFQRGDLRTGPLGADSLGHLGGELGLLEQHAAGEQKPNRPGFAGEFLGTGTGVLGQGVGRAIENVGGDFVALSPCGEHFAGQAGDFGLVGLGDPVDELLGGVELQPAEQPLAKRRPRAVAVEIKHAGLEGAQADFVAAAFVAENVAPAADLGRGAVGRLAEAAGAGAAEHEHAGGRFALGVGSEGGFEIVGGVDGGVWPSAGGGAAESQFIGGRCGHRPCRWRRRLAWGIAWRSAGDAWPTACR